jgi:hypothetical protein
MPASQKARDAKKIFLPRKLINRFFAGSYSEGFRERSTEMEGYDDCVEMGLEQILAEEPEIIDFENADAWREEIDLGLAEVKEDLYFLYADEYLEEIEANIDLIRVKPEIDNHLDWKDVVGQAIDKVRQNDG